MREIPAIGRPPVRLIELHTKVLAGLKDQTIRTGIGELRLTQICTELSEQGSLNLLQGKAKQTPPNLQGANMLAAFCCPDARPTEIVVGLIMPFVPTQITVAIIDEVLAEVKSDFARSWLTHWRNSYDLEMKRGRK